MQATITIEVAADRPPMKTRADSQLSPWPSGKLQHVEVGIDLRPSSSRPAAAIGSTNRLISTR